MNNSGRSVAAGAAVRFLGGLPVQLLGFVLTLASARILVPKSFGVYSLALAIYGFSDIVTNPSVQTFLLRDIKVEDRVINVAWTVSAIRGALMTGAFFVVAPALAAAFSGGEQVSELLRVLSLGFIAQGAKNLHVVRYHQRLQMGRAVVVDTGGTAIASLAAIGLLFWWRDPLALAVGTAAGPVLNTTLSWLIAPRRPRPLFDMAVVSKMWGFTRFLLLNAFVHYALTNLDDLMVARLVGTAALGIYNFSYSTVNSAILFVVRPLGEIVLPVLARLSGDRQAMGQGTRTAVGVFAALSWGITAPLFVLAPDLIRLITTNPAWLGATPVFRMLLPFVLVRGINNALGSAGLAAGEPKYLTSVSGAQLALMVPFGLIGLYLGGYAGLVLAIVALNTMSMLALTAVVPRLADVTTGQLLSTIASPAPAALVAAAATYATTAGLVAAPSVRVPLGIVTGLVAFLLTWELCCKLPLAVMKHAPSAVQFYRQRKS